MGDDVSLSERLRCRIANPVRLVQFQQDTPNIVGGSVKICCMCKLGLDTSSFKANSRKSDGLQSQCIECQKVYRKSHYQANKQKYIDKAKKWNDEFLVWWNDFKSALSCTECGEDHPATLDFHHTDPTQKESGVSYLVNCGSKAKALAEIEKCVVLCSNCHRKHHYNERIMRV